ncbi:MAG: type II secretion system F family protein, partial [Gammaproteobacteria bacterium]|nr:type II secretion system F family protein [Gammaproteobacteria bacterium]
MGAYEYTAVDARGKTRKGLLEGDSDRLVRRRLRDDGLVPLSVNEVDRRAVRSARGPAGESSRLGKRISGEDVSLFTRLLATLLKSGLPIDEALRAIADQTDRRPLKRAVLAVRSRINEGHSLGDAMAQLGRQLPDIYVATVQAGEQTKHLPLVLERLADFLEIRQQVRQKVKLALIYPIVLTAVSIAVVIGLLIYVIPEVTQIFDSVDRELPGITRALISTSDFL